MLAEHWLDFKKCGIEKNVSHVQKYLSKRIKQRRTFFTENGVRAYMELVFLDDETVQLHLKLLVMAKQWQKEQDEVSTSTNETINDKNKNNKPFI
ncbi:unnamed protein product [Rotaria sp. Silwood1]|nr:unnamed protein product [Rotaria sp. Silwood1]